MQNISAEQVVRIQVSLPQRLKLPNISSRQIGNTSCLAADHLEVVAIWRLVDQIFRTVVSRSIGRWLHDMVGELLGCHYFMGQWGGSG